MIPAPDWFVAIVGFGILGGLVFMVDMLGRVVLWGVGRVVARRAVRRAA